LPLLPILLCAASVAFAAIYAIGFAPGAPSPARSLVKTGAVAALALLGATVRAPLPVTAALVCGAVGDGCLSRPDTAAFLAGMAAFGLGHLLYALWAFDPAGVIPCLWPGVAVAILAASTELWLTPRTGALRWPVRAYVALIALMALAALTRGTPFVVAGAALFLLSDLLLALDIFILKPAPPTVQRLIWTAYWLGQAMIIKGSLAP